MENKYKDITAGSLITDKAVIFLLEKAYEEDTLHTHPEHKPKFKEWLYENELLYKRIPV